MLSGPVEDNGSSGHVDSHGERLCGEEDFNQTAAEAYLHNLLLHEVLYTKGRKHTHLWLGVMPMNGVLEMVFGILFCQVSRYVSPKKTVSVPSINISE